MKYTIKISRVRSITCLRTPQNIADTATDEEIRDFFTSRGCTAAADFPAAFFHKKLMKVFPSAKLVLTTRSPISWQKSMKESLYLVSSMLALY